MNKKILNFVIMFIFLFTQNILPINDNLCGINTLKYVCDYFKINTTTKELCMLTGYNGNDNLSMLSIYQAARQKGLPAVPLKIDIDRLCNIKGPVISFNNGNHFLIVNGCKNQEVIVQNPPQIPFMVHKDVFEKNWNGEVLVFSNNLSKRFAPKLEKIPINFQGPRIYFPYTTHYAGIVQEGEKLFHTFRFMNVGTDTLKIRTRSTCNCTIINLAKDNIPPNCPGEIKIEFETNGYRGKIKHGAHVRTNDNNNRIVNLQIAATINSPIKIIPNKIWLSDVKAKEFMRREILVFDSDNGSLKVEKIIAPKGIKATILPEKIIHGIRSIPIQFEIKIDDKAGDFRKHVKIILNNNNSEITFPISGIVN